VPYLFTYFDSYTFKRASGMGSYIAPVKRKMETLLPDAVKSGEDIETIKKRAKLDIQNEKMA